jgi:hypothetical protein
MVALDHTALFGHVKVPRLKFILTPLVAAVALIAVALALGAVLARGFSENGFRLGSQLAWRYAFFVFFAASIAGPVCRLTSHFLPGVALPESLSRKLVWGFCASYGVYLLSVFLPNVIRPSAGATLMVLFGAAVVVVMALAVVPLKRLAGMPVLEKARRAMLGAAAVYFWLCYSIMALARLSGPHRPDAFYGISLSLMVVALLVRYADRWFADRRLSNSQGRTMSNLRQSSVSK